MEWGIRLYISLFALLLLAVPLKAQEAAAADPPAVQQAHTPEAAEPSAENPEAPAPDQEQPAPKADEPKPEEPKPEATQPQQAKPEEKAQQPQNNPAETPEDKPAGEQQPAEEKPETEKPEAQKPDTKPEDKTAEEAKPEDNNPSTEEPAEKPEERKLELDEKTAEVLKQSYPKDVEDLRLIQKQVQRVVEYATPATVSVRVGQAFGSAVIVSPEGLVLTAGHVVGRPGQPVTFIFSDGKTARGKTLGMYREIDSGMMKITDPGPWPYVKMAKADDIKTGQWVVAIGHPGGFDPQRTPPVRLGRVLFANNDVISTDCTLVGGDSGGPLYNMQGDVVGIHSRIGRRITDNFHVPISTYHSTFDRLVAGESWGRGLGGRQQAEARPLLGVTGNPYEQECKLSEVYPNMPAAKAGIKPGDIVLMFNGKQVGSFDDLVKFVFQSKPGDTVKIEIDRGDETLNVELRLGLVPKPLPGSAEKPKQEEKKQEED